MKPLIYTTACIAVLTAGYIGQSKVERYHLIHQEELHRIISNERVDAWELGYRQADKDEFNKYAQLAAETHGFSRPDVMPPMRKPEDR